MQRIGSLLFLTFICFCSFAADLPVPEELIGKQTIGIVQINTKDLNYDQLVKSAEKAGPLPDNPLDMIKQTLEKFKEAGGLGISVLVHADKKTDPNNIHEGIVLVIKKTAEADVAKIEALLNEGEAPIKNVAATECPKKVGDSLVWYNAKFKLPAADAERAKEFKETYAEMGKDSSLSLVIVPDEDSKALVQSAIQDAKPDVAIVKPLLSASSLCISTNLGIATEPSLKILIVSEDADGAGKLKTAAAAMLGELKKDAPPPAQPFLESLKVIQKDANVQLSIELSELSKVLKAMLEPPK
jgi:hypothetical protein